jgi:hypothetical protein
MKFSSPLGTGPLHALWSATSRTLCRPRSCLHAVKAASVFPKEEAAQRIRGSGGLFRVCKVPRGIFQGHEASDMYCNSVVPQEHATLAPLGVRTSLSGVRFQEGPWRWRSSSLVKSMHTTASPQGTEPTVSREILKVEAALAIGDDKLVERLFKSLPAEEQITLLKDLYSKQITADGFERMDINRDGRMRSFRLVVAYFS